jgi:hypothetical protein
MHGADERPRRGWWRLNLSEGRWTEVARRYVQWASECEAARR